MNKLHETFSTDITFIGQFEILPSAANLGDVCIVDGRTYIYGFNWQELGKTAIGTTIEIVKIKNQTLYLT